MKWISVKKKLPNVNQSVLTVRLNTVSNMYLHDSGKWKTDGYGVKSGPSFTDVTHWMPLPAAPEVEE